MELNKVVIEKMISIDETGMPIAPNIRQLQDKDVLELYSRDKTTDKKQYMSEVGVIYYLGDPKSPARQQGCNDKEALKMAIDNYNLPKDYQPDVLVTKIIKKYYRQNITEAGVALEALEKSVHLVAIAATRINDYLMINYKILLVMIVLQHYCLLCNKLVNKFKKFLV